MKKALLSLLIIVFFTTCKNDLKLNAPYKEIPSVYAVLCPQDNFHMIRVNKVFLGEGDANAMAKISDSINYPAGELTITLDRYINGQQVDAAPISRKRTIVFRDSVIQTEKGAFNSTQRVYVANEDLHEGLPIIGGTFSVNINTNWKVSGDYVLTVKNNRTGNVFIAKSTIVDSIRPHQLFSPFIGYYYPTPPGAPADQSNFIDYTELINQTYPYTITYPTNEAKIYQLSLRFYYIDDFGARGKFESSIEYPFGTQLERDKQTKSFHSVLVTNFKGKDLFSYVGSQLAKTVLPDVIGRKMTKLQYIIYSSTQDYSDYLEYSKPSLNITSNKQLYSNFENKSAMGIFTFKARCSVYKAMSTGFVSAFQQNASTCQYNFYNADESRHGCFK